MIPASVSVGCVACLGALMVTRAAAAAELDSVSQGVVVDASIGSGPVGDMLLGELGGQSAGITTFRDGAWLLRWDALLAFKAGVLAAAHPFTPLVGGRARLFAEPGYRFQPDCAWSAYAGARIAGDLQILLPPGTALSKLDTVNDIGGVGGVNASGSVGLSAGASLIEGRHGLLLTAFAQEEGRAADTYSPGIAFTEIGLAVRFDLAHSLMLEGEALWGRSSTATDTRLGIGDQTTHEAVAVAVRKVLGNGVWLGLSVAYAVDTDHVSSTGGGPTFDTADAPVFDVTARVGIPLGKQEWP